MRALFVFLLALTLASPVCAQTINGGQPQYTLGTGLTATGSTINNSEPYTSGQAFTDMVAAGLITSTTAASTYALVANGLPTYTAGGSPETPSHVVVTTCTLAIGTCTITLTGSAAYTSSTTYSCAGADQNLTTTLSTVINISGTSVKVLGSLTDTIRVFCIGW